VCGEKQNEDSTTPFAVIPHGSGERLRQLASSARPRGRVAVVIHIRVCNDHRADWRTVQQKQSDETYEKFPNSRCLPPSGSAPNVNGNLMTGTSLDPTPTNQCGIIIHLPVITDLHVNLQQLDNPATQANTNGLVRVFFIGPTRT
jgi:hypothetical protein